MIPSLPVPAIDHGTGFVLAAGILRALTQRARAGRASELRVSLARTAAFLDEIGVPDAITGQPLAASELAPYMEAAGTAWGPVRRVRCPGSVDGVEARWERESGPLGSSDPVWL